VSREPDSIVNKQNALLAAGLAANKLGVMSNPVGLGIEMIAAGDEVDAKIKETAKTLGSDTLHLKAGSPAFKRFVKEEMPAIYEDRAIGYGFAIAGGALAIGAATMFMGGPPGWILGIVIAGVGTLGSGLIKDAIWPSSYNTFLDFAKDLQAGGENRDLRPEAAFVALTLNLDENSQRAVFNSLPKSLDVTDKKKFMRLLKTERGMEALHYAMTENDELIRAGVGAMSASPGGNISEKFTQLVNEGQMAGVDLLDQQKTGHLGNMIAIGETHRLKQRIQQLEATRDAPNPNASLPNLKNNQLAVTD